MNPVIQNLQDAKEIANEWNSIVAAQADVPNGLGPTSSYELCVLLYSMLAPTGDLRIYNNTVQDKTCGVLPCYRENIRNGLLTLSKLAVISDLYPGRCGPIQRDIAADEQHSPISRALNDSQTWDIFDIIFVEDSNAETYFLAQVEMRHLFYQRIARSVYPYIALPSSWDDLLAGFSKKFRYNLRSRDKKLHAEHSIDIRCYSTHDDIAEYLDFVKIIERNSWKESAGTSLTRNPVQMEFHEAAVLALADRGELSSYVLLADGQPAAHIIGALSNGTFYCFKSSVSEAFRKHSPGVVLKGRVMQQLIESGATHWDFVGPVEDHKQQWTRNTYALNRYRVYSTTFRGRLAAFQATASKYLRFIGKNNEVVGASSDG